MEELSRAHSLLAGLGGTGVVIAATSLARRRGWKALEFPRLIGTVLGEDIPATRAAGWALFVGNGALLAVGYREAARLLGARATVSGGAAMGLLHGLVAAGLAVALSSLHPRPVQAGLGRWVDHKPPAAGLAVLIGVHVLYGAVLGLIARQLSAPERP